MVKYTAEVQEEFISELVNCAKEYAANFDLIGQKPGDNPSCPNEFQPNLVEFDFEYTEKLRITTSTFNTSSVADIDDLYDVYQDFDTADGKFVKGIYDTAERSLYTHSLDSLFAADMSLALVSLLITFIAMLIHTKSPWLTLFGVLQIIFAIPLAYFVYRFVAGLVFFPFLNFIGVFVSAALGADDLFVAVDKFKNARINNPQGSTEDIAQVALPNAAGAMLLTSSTTMVAFFATTICKVPPVLCFAVYCGLMIFFNYIMTVFLVFPALCLYDIWLQNGSNNPFVAICTNRAVEEDLDDLENIENARVSQRSLSLIHRILTTYYNYLYKFRWFVLTACIAATAVSAYYSFTLPVPETMDVMFLPESDPFELHFAWRNLLLDNKLFTQGNKIQIIFGLKAADNGNQNEPDMLSVLVLDETFKPSTKEFQEYLKGFCDRLFEGDFCNKPENDYECAINRFDTWLQTESGSATPSEVYEDYCNGAMAIPMAEEDFDKCIVAWSKSVQSRDILDENGVVRVIVVDGKQTGLSFQASNEDMRKSWDAFELFLEKEKERITSDWYGFIHVSMMWWWHDTTQQMLRTAVGAAAIAVAFSAIVVLFSSRSLLLTLFSGFCILYVLSATTASLVGLGWELGFLEAVCFAILVGISCDFVIHFGHAYIHYKGNVDRVERTKFALLHMGPSILAAAVTTFAAAIVMLFCKVVFFKKFAMVLLMTICHATVGSFVLYIVINAIFGPAEPTKFIDGIFGCFGVGNGNTDRIIDMSSAENSRKEHSSLLRRVDYAAVDGGGDAENRVDYNDQLNLDKSNDSLKNPQQSQR